MATSNEVKETLESLASLLETASAAVSVDDFDIGRHILDGLSTEAMVVISQLTGRSLTSIRFAIEAFSKILTPAEKVLTSDQAIRFAAFLRDAENRTLLINIIARWL